MLDGSKAMPSKTGSVKRGQDESNVDEEEKEQQEFNDTDMEMKKAGIELTERMGEASGLLNIDSEDKEEVYNTPDTSTVDPLKDNKGEELGKAAFSKYLDNNDLKPEDYDLDILEVSSREFDASHTQKYKEPANFLQALWNMAGSSAGSMKIQLKMRRKKLKGKLAGILADNANMPFLLVNYLVKEVGEDTQVAINCINKIASKLEEYEEDSIKTLVDGEEEPEDSCGPAPNKGGGQQKASKAQGMLPGAPKENPAEEVAMDTATAAGGTRRERTP